MTRAARLLLGTAALLVAGVAGREAFSSAGGAAVLAASRPGAMAAATGDAAAVPLDSVVRRIHRCGAEAPRGAAACSFVVYFWSARMPLSAEGIAGVGAAAAGSGAEALVVDASELEDRGRVDAAPPDEVVAEMLAAGATLHYPSLLVYSAGRPAGGAILGYKSAAAWRALLRERLASPPAAPDAAVLPAPDDSLRLSVELPVDGRPGAYFRAVPGRQTLVYESGSTINLLDLRDGSTVVGPGHIDFVPSPDGRLFVTPGANGSGLQFYDADEVFAAAARGAGRLVEPVHVDPGLRDQYPSVGVLRRSAAAGAGTTVYRVLTSWFDGIAYRDFEVRYGDRPGSARVQPVGPRTPACRRVSIPILSPDGREVAGRDELSGTTKIYRLDGDRCEEVADLALPSGKVAWSPDGRRLAFAIPAGAIRDGDGTVAGGAEPRMAGIFLFYRDGARLRRVPGSDDAHRLAFPEFVGADSLVYLLATTRSTRSSVFRLVCCVD